MRITITKKNATVFYAIIHALYFCTFALISGYASAYLLNRGFTNAQIGIMLGIGNLGAVGFQLLVASFIARTGIRLGKAIIAVHAVMAALALARGRFGRLMVAMRENEERSRMLGYNPFAVKLAALAISGLYAGAAGAAYALLFGYVGASFATVQYSILPLLYVLLGGAGTVLGPLVGTAVMFFLVDIASAYTTAWLMVVGIALVIVTLFAPRGILGALRERWVPWLP